MSHRLDYDKQLKSHHVNCEWHRTFQRLVTVSTLMILYVAAVIAVDHLVPGITIKEAMLVAGAAGAGPAGGYGLIVAGQAFRRWRYRRRSPSGDDSSS